MRNAGFIWLFALAALLGACGTGNPPPPLTARDTSITASNAYTRLSLDSSDLASFLAAGGLPGATDTAIRNFYSARNYQYAWFNEEGLTEQAQAFQSLLEQRKDLTGDSALYGAGLGETLDTLLNGDSLPASPQTIKSTELRLTAGFFRYLDAAFGGRADPADLQWYIPVRKLAPVAMLDSFLQRKPGSWRPLGAFYDRLQQKLITYAAIVRRGGWDSIKTPARKLSKGDTGMAVIQLRRRLAITGHYHGDSSAVFDAALQRAVREVQPAFGLAPTGVATRDLIDELNTPAEQRIGQMMVNLERLRWMPDISRKTRIIVNIPEYRLHVLTPDSQALDMRIVVGKAAHRTVIFSDELQYIVFSPYWNVPPSIVRHEILPAMKKDGSYLRRNDMEITGNSGGLPVIRQRPGAQNALGRVKFLFPNRYNIYLHDTPAKSLFGRDKRAFSHGCIRLQHPFELAQYLLKDDSSWTGARIRKAMHGSRETWVKLRKPVPVFIVYLTCWVDAGGQLQFRDDIYGHDAGMESHLFRADAR